MKDSLLDVLCCPKCFGELKLQADIRTDNIITKGELYCQKCKTSFVVHESVPVFGVEDSTKKERFKEIKGENEWIINANEIQDHLNFAQESSKAGERIIRKINSKRHDLNRKLKVLDIGSGWGCFQSWQFASNDFEVVAVDICPEFILASDLVSKSKFFERVISDCTILPFINCSFDVIFCKELIHHVGNASDLLDEIWRVASPDALIIIKEPCTSTLITTLMRRERIAKIDVAAKVGVTHYYLTYGSCLKYMKSIAGELEIDRENLIIDQHRFKLLSILQQPILTIERIKFFNRMFSTMHLILIGGNLEIIGRKRKGYKAQISRVRDIFQIHVQTINMQQIDYYRNVLIPQTFKIFRSANTGMDSPRIVSK